MRTLLANLRSAPGVVGEFDDQPAVFLGRRDVK
jgi:hypothetical protein